jgi:hypothetical protein
MHSVDLVWTLHNPAFPSNLLAPDRLNNMTIALLISVMYSRSSQVCSAEDTASNDVALALASGSLAESGAAGLSILLVLCGPVKIDSPAREWISSMLSSGSQDFDPKLLGKAEVINGIVKYDM